MTLLSVGIALIVAAGLTAALLIWRQGVTNAAFGMLSGAGVPMFYLAWDNRNGPGDVCTHTATSSSCVSESSPWPWLLVGVILVVAGISSYQIPRHHRRPLTV